MVWRPRRHRDRRSTQRLRIEGCEAANFHSMWDGAIIDDILGIDRPPHDFAPRLATTRPEAADLNRRISGVREARWAPPGLAANLGAATEKWAKGRQPLAEPRKKKFPPDREAVGKIPMKIIRG